MPLNKPVKEEELKKELARQGYRFTRPREVILELLRSASCHPDAQWIYGEVRKQLPRISLGTVYRTLNVLAQSGLIREIQCGEDGARYDGNVQAHYHVRCRECGVVQDVFLPQIKEIERSAAALTDFDIDAHRLEFFGCCAHCREQRAQETPAPRAASAASPPKS